MKMVQSNYPKTREIIQSSSGPHHLSTILLKDSHLFKIVELAHNSPTSFGKSPKLLKLQNTLYTLKMCELCLDTNLLSMYDNERGKENRLK